MQRFMLILLVVTLCSTGAWAQLTLVIERNHSTSPIQVLDQSHLLIPVNSTVSSLDLRAVVSNPSPPGNMTLTTTFTGVGIPGVQTSEWQAGPSMSQIEAMPTTGAFSTPGAIEIIFTASDTSNTVIKKVYADVVNASNIMNTNIYGANFAGAVKSSAMFDLTTNSDSLNVTDIWTTFSNLIGSGTSDVQLYIRNGTAPNAMRLRTF
jgi:hypothetical protein